jgi:hypothetical protein
MTLAIPDWSATELQVMRIGLGFVVIKTFSRMLILRPVHNLRHPVGLARVVDLRLLSSRTVVKALQYGAYLAALCYAADRLVPFALGYLSVALILEITYRSSDGSVDHGDHLLATVLIAQFAATVVWNAADRWSWNLDVLAANSQQATAVWWSIQAIAAVYFTSGMSKLINTGGRWIGRSTGLLLAGFGRLETQRMTPKGSAANGREPAGIRNAEIVLSALSSRPVLVQCVFAAGLLIELASPIGLLGESVLMAAGLSLIALHVGNQVMLRLPFPEYQLLILIYFVNLPRLFW